MRGDCRVIPYENKLSICIKAAQPTCLSNFSPELFLQSVLYDVPIECLTVSFCMNFNSGLEKRWCDSGRCRFQTMKAGLKPEVKANQAEPSAG